LKTSNESKQGGTIHDIRAPIFYDKPRVVHLRHEGVEVSPHRQSTTRSDWFI